VKDYDDYVTRLRTIPEVFAQTTELLEQGVAKQLMPPRILLEQCVRQTEKLATDKPEDSPFAGPLKKFPADIPAAEQARIRAAVPEQVQPAYRVFGKYLHDEYVPHGRSEVGLWSLPDGDARYAARVRDMTTTDLTPEQIHEIGLQEVARIEAEQAAVGKRLGF